MDAARTTSKLIREGLKTLVLVQKNYENVWFLGFPIDFYNFFPIPICPLVPWAHLGYGYGSVRRDRVVTLGLLTTHACPSDPKLHRGT